MKSEWTNLVLGDSLELLIDNRGKNPPYSESGIPCVSGMVLTDHGFNWAKAKFISQETWEKWMPAPTQKNDVILTSEAPLGRAALLKTDDPIALTQRVFGLRGKKGVLDSQFLYYALRTHRVQSEIQSRATGTTVIGIRQPALLKVAIPAPVYTEQRAIAEVLGALDDKIAANREHMRTIDEFLSALFKSISSHASVKSLQEVATVNPSTVTPDSEGTLRYIDISSVGRGYFEYPDVSSWKDAPSRARRHVQSADIIWSTVRPSRQSHALILENDELLVASTGLAVIRPQDKSFAYLYEATKVSMFSSYLESVAEGSAYPAVRAELFGMAPILWALDSDRSFFESVAAPLRYRAQTLISENRVLAATRDALLAPLMSGKLRIREAEAVVEDVL